MKGDTSTMRAPKDAQAVTVAPSPMDVLMRQRREALVLELRAVEEFLGMKPSVRAVCPNCGREWNKKAG